MSGKNIVASMIDGAARGHLAGVSQAHIQNTATWKKAYNDLLKNTTH